MNNIFISFIEEFWQMKPQYKDYIIGRVEVYGPKDFYASEEIRFRTDKQDEFYKFREKWDFKDISKRELIQIRAIVREKFYDKTL